MIEMPVLLPESPRQLRWMPARKLGAAAIARIFAVVDVFDALTSERPYKKPLALAEALTMIESDSDRHFDPEVVAVLKKIAPNFHARAVLAGDANFRQAMQRFFPDTSKRKRLPKEPRRKL